MPVMVVLFVGSSHWDSAIDSGRLASRRLGNSLDATAGPLGCFAWCVFLEPRLNFLQVVANALSADSPGGPLSVDEECFADRLHGPESPVRAPLNLTCWQPGHDPVFLSCRHQQINSRCVTQEFGLRG